MRNQKILVSNDGIGSGLVFRNSCVKLDGYATQLSNIYTVTIARTPAQRTLVSLNGPDLQQEYFPVMDQ